MDQIQKQLKNMIYNKNKKYMFQIKLFPSVVKNHKSNQLHTLKNNIKKPSISQILSEYQNKKTPTRRLKSLLTQRSKFIQIKPHSRYCKKDILKKKDIKQTQIQLFKKNINKYDRLRQTIKQIRREQFHSKQWLFKKEKIKVERKSQKSLITFNLLDKQILTPQISKDLFSINKKKYVEISAKQLMYETQSKELPQSVERKIIYIRQRAKTQFQGCNQV